MAMSCTDPHKKKNHNVWCLHYTGLKKKNRISISYNFTFSGYIANQQPKRKKKLFKLRLSPFKNQGHKVSYSIYIYIYIYI